MNRSRLHHFVPKVLQKSFCSHGDHIWYTRRDETMYFGPVEDRNIESTFRVRDLYTVLDSEHNLSDELEREHYGAIDDYLGELLPWILSQLDRGNSPTFSGDSLKSLQLVVYEMIKRTPEFFRDFDDEQVGKEVIENALNVKDKIISPDELEEVKRKLTDKVRLRHIGRSVRARSIAGPSNNWGDDLELLNALSEFEPRWMISGGKHSFVLSSLIAYRIGNGCSNGFSNRNMEIWMPISPNYALVLLRDPGKKIPLRGQENREHIREVNEYAVRNSSFLASHSSKLLRSLVRKAGPRETQTVLFTTRG